MLAQDRWLYWLGGCWGPKVLFLGELFVVLLISIALGKYKVGPLGTASWILLGLGLATLSPLYMLVPVCWFILLMLKEKQETKSRFWYNFRQLFIIIFTILNISVLFDSVKSGLILYPNVNIVGISPTNMYEHASLSKLSWYQDRIASIIDTPTIASAPIWFWRVFMLLWSLWLTVQMIKWLIWGWKIFSNKMWMPKAK